MSPLVMSLISALLISSLSLATIFLVFLRLKNLKKITLYLVAFAVGSLLGDAFLHLIPESYETIDSSVFTSLFIILGMLLFFIIEKVLRWRHCHDPDCQDSHHGPLVALNFIGDSVHNFIDGMLIAASFMVGPTLGLSTSLAVIFHEIPQEIGDFSIFIHSGLGVAKTVRFNFLSALFSIAGVILTFLLGSLIENFSLYLLPLTAGGFIYLAASDLIPELHRKRTKALSSFLELLLIILGVALMVLLLFLE
ncbi:MAG: ZIP family metal transporter [Patescibacteria group bacterium]|jgi:zinc and cadmium transporter